MLKVVFKRFLKGTIMGAVAQMGIVSFTQPTMWSDFHLILNNLAIAGAFGALTGFLLALQKWASWKE